MFSKQMDVLAEELMADDTEALQVAPNLKIGALLWVDDLVSCTEGPVDQEKMLHRVDEFAIKNKIKWGKGKCNVLQVGKKVDQREQWIFGDMEIDTVSEYKYLGDIITKDGKNRQNLESRRIKIHASTTQIKIMAGNEVLRQVQAATHTAARKNQSTKTFRKC